MPWSLVGNLFSTETDDIVDGWAETDLPGAILSVPRLRASNDLGAWAFTSGQVNLTYVYPTTDRPISTLNLPVGAAGGTATTARLGVLSVDSSGNLALLAYTANDTDLFTSGYSLKSKTLNTSVNLVAGQVYAFALCIVTSNAMPTLYGALGSNGIFTFEPKVASAVVATDLPSSIASTDLITYGMAGVAISMWAT